MAGPDDVTKAMTRLETALERIAHLSARPRPAVAAHPDQPAGMAEPSNADLAARLDTLIDQLRSALSPEG